MSYLNTNNKDFLKTNTYICITNGLKILYNFDEYNNLDGKNIRLYEH